MLRRRRSRGSGARPRRRSSPTPRPARGRPISSAVETVLASVAFGLASRPCSCPLADDHLGAVLRDRPPLDVLDQHRALALLQRSKMRSFASRSSAAVEEGAARRRRGWAGDRGEAQMLSASIGRRGPPGAEAVEVDAHGLRSSLRASSRPPSSSSFGPLLRAGVRLRALGLVERHLVALGRERVTVLAQGEAKTPVIRLPAKFHSICEICGA
jgi:hypothetical protein